MSQSCHLPGPETPLNSPARAAGSRTARNTGRLGPASQALSLRRSISRCAVLLIAASLFASQHSTAAGASNLAETTFIKSNDTQLYLELRGPATRSPILLYLHGGPGRAIGVISFRSYVGPALESRFLVCYLH